MTGRLDRDRWRRLERILDEVLDLPPDQRDRRLDDLAASDPQLAAEARAFLRDTEHAARDDRLARPAGERAAGLIDHATRGDAPEARLGQRLGAWELTGILGEGGMGVVYTARRADGQYEAAAAVKLMLAVDPRSPLRDRLLAERQILAQLDDPRIARLFDGGLDPDGHPYLVMERVAGRPLTEHCEAAGLGLAARLDLLAEVCAAVDAAHRRMVLHCDLKPSNILVTDRGELKLLDFGVARPLEGLDATTPAGTTAGANLAARLFTPGYASPEQIAARPLTAASDVYALGVLLHELLTGARPADAETPAAPAAASGLARAAGKPWARRLRGDLDRIVARALAADPSRRYATARELAADLRRWQRREPVAAASDSAWYRLRKRIDRNRLATAALVVVIAVVLAGAAGTAWQARVAATERDQARREALRAQTVSTFLQDLFTAADPNVSVGADVTARELLARGREQIGQLASEPQERAALLDVLADVHFRLGLYQHSRDLHAARLATFRELEGPQGPWVTDARIDLASSLIELGEIDAAAAQIDSCLAWRRTRPRDDPDWLGIPRSIRARIASERRDFATAVPLYREVLATFDPEDPGRQEALGRGWTNLGVALAGLGRSAAADSAYARAEVHFRRSLPEHHSSFGSLYGNWALTAQILGDLERAERLQRQALTIKRRLKHNQVEIGLTLTNLGNLLVERGRPAEALPHLQEALAIQRDAFGERHLYVAAAEINLGLGLLATGDAPAADRRFATGERIFRDLYGDDSTPVAVALTRRAQAARARGDLAGAADLLRESVAMHRRQLPNGRRRLGQALLHQADLASAMQDRELAGAAAREAADILTDVLGADHADTRRAHELAAAARH